MTVHAAPPAPTTTTRWRFVDALRGFALFGILLVNVPDITRLGWDTHTPTGVVHHDPVDQVLNLLVQTRFVPIFVFLFGMGMHFVLTGARRRAPRPGLVLVRRMAALGLIGAVLLVVYRGNVLIEYGFIGLFLVPVVLFSPRWLLLLLGTALTVTAYVLTGGGLAATPGLMLLGAGAAAYGLPAVLEHAGRRVALVGLVALAASVPFVLVQISEGLTDTRYSDAGSTAGLFLAVAYTSGLALLWRTPLRRLLALVFEPLGRMALTNYVAAAVVVFVVGVALDFRGLESEAPAVVLGVVVIALQSVLSRLWLRHFVYGPVEWAWRTVTWWRPAAFVRRQFVPR
jgi:uncharacterized protein